MSQAGSWNWTAARASRTKATTLRSWKSRRSASSRESNEEAPSSAPSAREREWIKQSPKARQAKSKARINSYEELVAKSQEQRAGTATIMIPVAERLGDLVIEAENLAKGYGDRLLYENVNFKLPRAASSA